MDYEEIMFYDFSPSIPVGSSGVNMFKNRQSSSPTILSVPGIGCTHGGGYLVALIIPSRKVS